MSELPPLKPCPFCGGKASYEEFEGTWSVGCEDVDSNGIEVVCIGFQSLTTFARKIDAAAAWNRRPDDKRGNANEQRQ